MTLKKALEIVRPMEVDRNLRPEQRTAIETLTLALDGKREYRVHVKATADISDSETVFASSPEEAAQLAVRQIERQAQDPDWSWNVENFRDIRAISVNEVTADDDQAAE